MSDLAVQVEQLGKAVTALTEFNRDLHKALKEISAPVVDLSAVKIPAQELPAFVSESFAQLKVSVEAIGELQAEQDEKINKIGELLFKFISDMSADAKQPAKEEPKKQANSRN